MAAPARVVQHLIHERVRARDVVVAQVALHLVDAAREVGPHLGHLVLGQRDLEPHWQPPATELSSVATVASV